MLDTYESDMCHHSEVFRSIVWAIENDYETVYFPEGGRFPFSLRAIDGNEYVRFRTAVLESGTRHVSIPGADRFPCLFGDGSDAKWVKEGMLYVPPRWFHEKPEWRARMREGLRYIVDSVIGIRSEALHA